MGFIFKQSNSRKLKPLFLTILCLVSIYIGSWFYAAHHLKKTLKDLPFKTNSQSLAFEKVKISGFPFKLKAKITNLFYQYHLKNNLIDLSFYFSSDSLNAETNLLFADVDFYFPKKSSLIFVHSNKVSKFDILSSKDHYLKLSEASIINTHRIIQNLYLKKQLNYQDFDLEKITYHAGDLTFIDKNTDKRIINSNSSINASMKYTSNALTGLRLTTTNNIRILDNQYVGHEFHDFSGKIDINSILKPHGNIFSITSVDFNLLQLEVDKSKFTLTGSAKNSETDGLNVDLILKLTKWNEFTDQLLKQQILSLEKISILKNLMHTITGEENITDIDIKIYNSKDDSLRIGNSDMNGISPYLQQLTMSQ